MCECGSSNAMVCRIGESRTLPACSWADLASRWSRALGVLGPRAEPCVCTFGWSGQRPIRCRQGAVPTRVATETLSLCKWIRIMSRPTKLIMTSCLIYMPRECCWDSPDHYRLRGSRADFSPHAVPIAVLSQDFNISTKPCALTCERQGVCLHSNGDARLPSQARHFADWQARLFRRIWQITSDEDFYKSIICYTQPWLSTRILQRCQFLS